MEGSSDELFVRCKEWAGFMWGRGNPEKNVAESAPRRAGQWQIVTNSSSTHSLPLSQTSLQEGP